MKVSSPRTQQFETTDKISPLRLTVAGNSYVNGKESSFDQSWGNPLLHSETFRSNALQLCIEPRIGGWNTASDAFSDTTPMVIVITWSSSMVRCHVVRAPEHVYSLIILEKISNRPQVRYTPRTESREKRRRGGTRKVFLLRFRG
jgi:hypothetical protein